jgi:predicted acyltransferase (DUF342 family)
MSNRLTKGEALTGTIRADDDVIAGDDVTAGDDLVVGDDASVAGNLAVTGNATVTGNIAGANLTATGTINLGDPVSVIADPTGGSTVDAESRAAIVSILDALDAVGIMAAS